MSPRSPDMAPNTPPPADTQVDSAQAQPSESRPLSSHGTHFEDWMKHTGNYRETTSNAEDGGETIEEESSEEEPDEEDGAEARTEEREFHSRFSAFIDRWFGGERRFLKGGSAVAEFQKTISGLNRERARVLDVITQLKAEGARHAAQSQRMQSHYPDAMRQRDPDQVAAEERERAEMIREREAEAQELKEEIEDETERMKEFIASQRETAKRFIDQYDKKIALAKNRRAEVAKETAPLREEIKELRIEEERLRAHRLKVRGIAEKMGASSRFVREDRRLRDEIIAVQKEIKKREKKLERPDREDAALEREIAISQQRGKEVYWFGTGEERPNVSEDTGEPREEPESREDSKSHPFTWFIDHWNEDTHFKVDGVPQSELDQILAPDMAFDMIRRRLLDKNPNIAQALDHEVDRVRTRMEKTYE